MFLGGQPFQDFPRGFFIFRSLWDREGVRMNAGNTIAVLIERKWGDIVTEGQIDKESQPLFATARLWDDGVIDPRHTRDVVGICLSTAHTAPVEGTTSWGVFRH